MVQGKWFPTGGDIEQALKIRRAVFNRGRDATDALAQQVVVYNQERPVGTARLWWEDGAFRLGDVGVLPEERGRGYGDLLVRLLLFKSLTHNAERITLCAPQDSQSFFARYGFKPLEDGEMAIQAKDVQLSHCGGDCAHCESRTPECTPKALR